MSVRTSASVLVGVLCVALSATAGAAAPNPSTIARKAVSQQVLETPRADVLDIKTNKPMKIAVIYRGPGGGCRGCSEAVERMLATDPTTTWVVRYAGEFEPLKVSRRALTGAALYVQPGGDQNIEKAWAALGRDGQQAVREFVANGGRYLGICMGAFLAGKFGSVGWGWLSGVDEYEGRDNVNIGHGVDTVLRVQWSHGTSRAMYFSEGPHVNDAQATTLAKFSNGAGAAAIKNAGKGRVGFIGPHPEADRSWYNPPTWGDPDGYDADLGIHVLRAVMQ